jgi:CMP-N-acetylneuraminic acid synthetase
VKTAIVVLARAKYCKRIPHKPLAKFLNKTLIEWTLEFSKRFDYETWVYSDMDLMREICEKAGVNYREKQLEAPEGKHKTTEELRIYNEEIKADRIILLQVTSPLRSFPLASTWIKDFEKGDADIGFTVNSFNKYVYNDKAEIMNCPDRGYNKSLINFTETGSFYIFGKEQLDKETIFEGSRMMFLDPYDLDIDTYDDLKKAEYLAKEGYYAY